eukprot:TRINITY_DN9171_c0_g1_i1.p1 TRINITY_DN9171_c0_g1~~TRINITY_DN9171_c0_g1_i1.p1  ORF type:complete len:175 (+),score=22.79 TRINITY_DN9171_c0_g1_i1:34-558(+)
MGTVKEDEKIRAWFEAVDTDGSGKLDNEELVEALQQAGLNFSLMSTGMMIKLFDRQREGKLTLDLFVELYSWISRQKEAFLKFDTDNSGKLDLDNGEVLSAVISAGFRLDAHSFDAAFRAYDPDCDRSMTLTEFVGLCAFLTLCLNTFSSFDRAGEGEIKLNFCQYVFACANCK